MALTGLRCKVQARLSLPFRGTRCLRGGGGCDRRGASGDEASGGQQRRESSRWGCSLQLWKQKDGGGGFRGWIPGGRMAQLMESHSKAPLRAGPGHSRASRTATSPSSPSSRLTSSKAHSPQKCQSGSSPWGRQPVGRWGGTEPLSSSPLPVLLSLRGSPSSPASSPRWLP